MFKSLFGITTDVLKVVTAPIEIVADVARGITKPAADIAEEVVKGVKEEMEN